MLSNKKEKETAGPVAARVARRALLSRGAPGTLIRSSKLDQSSVVEP